MTAGEALTAREDVHYKLRMAQVVAQAAMLRIQKACEHTFRIAELDGSHFETCSSCGVVLLNGKALI